MSGNRELQVARRYHQGTKHPDGFLLDPTHRYHPPQRPLLFKRYVDLETINLDVDPDSLKTPALKAIAQPGFHSDQARVPDLGDIAALLFLSAGITKRIHYRGFGEMYFRAASCTGALYHIELYLVCGELPGLNAGVYHFDPASLTLDVLRQGDYRRVLLEAAGRKNSIAPAQAFVVYSDVHYRNACKYQTRAYRHTFWDSGTILSHSLAVAGGQEFQHQMWMGFVDSTVNGLLGLDVDEEVALAVLTLGADPDHDLPLAPDVPPLGYDTVSIAEDRKQFLAIQEMHQASSLSSPEEVSLWRQTSLEMDPPTPPRADLIPLMPASHGDLPQDSLSDVIRRRGSSRKFSHDPLSFQELSTLLVRSTKGFPADFQGEDGLSQNVIYLIVHNVEDLEPGAYVYHGDERALERLRQGNFRGESRRLALGQDLGGDCAVAIYFLTDLDRVLEGYGNRGYRTAQIEASIIAGKMYLAAYAQSFGATGLTFYDDPVRQFFSPHAEGKQVMFLIAVGVPV